jgi:hypothetical protein
MLHLFDAVNSMRKALYSSLAPMRSIADILQSQSASDQMDFVPLHSFEADHLYALISFGTV